jgi:hypothetical protein
LRHGFDLAGHGIEAGRAVGQDRRRQQHAVRPVTVDEFHQCRIAGAVRVGIAQEHLVTLEHDIVVAAGGGRIGEAQGSRDLVAYRIDQRNRRVAVLVLQCPDLAGVRVEFQAIDGTRNRVAMLDMPRLVVLNDRARTAGAGGIRAVAVFDETCRSRS